MMNKEQLLKTDTLKNKFQQSKGQMRPEKALLLSKERKFSFQHILPNIRSCIALQINALHYPKSGKN